MSLQQHWGNRTDKQKVYSISNETHFRVDTFSKARLEDFECRVALPRKNWKLFKYTRGQGELRFSRSAFWYENGGLFCFFASVDHLTQSFRRIRIERRYVKHFLKCPKITLNHSKQYFCTLETSRRPPFLFWLLLIDGAVDQSETPLILKLRPSSVYQGSIYQFWSSGFDDTWRQPKGVELGN